MISSDRQRGIGTLAVSVLLLLIMSVVVFYANRHLMLEQRTANSFNRSAESFEAAEAGMEWALGLLNTPLHVDATCEKDGKAGASFRMKYLAPAAGKFNPASAEVGCKFVGGKWVCACPDSGSVTLADSAGPSFTVRFGAVDATDAPTATAEQRGTFVRIVVTGCSSNTKTTACQPGSVDAISTIAAVLKSVPLLPNVPPAPIVCGGTCDLTKGTYNIINTSVATNGILVNSGSTTLVKPGGNPGYESIPGQPWQAAVVDKDQSLLDLAKSDTNCDKSAVFRAFFGTTIEEFARSPGVTHISCSTDCYTKIKGEYDGGARVFYFDGDVKIQGNLSLGTEADPMIFVTNSNIDIRGTFTLYATIFSDQSSFNDDGTGTADIHGSIVSCNNYANNGSGTVIYNENVFKNSGLTSGTMAKVPGSWCDWSKGISVGSGRCIK